MPTIIKPKRSSTTGVTPTTANLVEGEIAINLPDKKLFVRDTANNILTLAEPVIPAVEDAADIDMTGDLKVQGDFTAETNVGIGNYGGGPFAGTPQHTLEAYTPDAQTNKLLHTMRAPAPTNGANPELYIKTDFTGSNGTVNVGEHGWRHMGVGGNTGKDRFEVIHISDDGTASNKMLSMQYDSAVYISRTNVGSALDWRISTGGTIDHLIPTNMQDTLTVNSLSSLQKVQLNTAAADINSMLDTTVMPNTDTLHNHLRATLDYGASAVPDGAKSSVTFSVKDDTDGDRIVARFASQHNTNDNNKMEIETSDNNGNFTKHSFSNTEMTPGTPIKLFNAASDPANPDNGWIYYNTTTDKMRLYAGGAWTDLN